MTILPSPLSMSMF